MGRQKKYNGYFRKTFMYNEKRVYVYGKTAEELHQNEIKKRQELEDAAEDYYNPSIRDYYKHFTDVRRRELKEVTLKTQQSQFRSIAEVVMPSGVTFGDMRMQDITRRDIETAREIMLQEGKTPENLNIMFGHLNHVFATAVLDDTIAKNPCKALKRLKRESPLIGENRHRALSEDETKRFFEAAEARHSYYLNNFLLMIKTGMRVGEISALYPTDIDRINNFIHVRRTITRDEIGCYMVGNSTKTYSGNRDIPLTDELLEIIKRQQALNHAIFGLEKDGLLFKSAEGDILKGYSVNREIKRICRAAGIEYFSCHAFRATFATRFIEQRPEDYKILSEILGHKDVSITLNLYTHVMTENKVIAMQDVQIKTS